jgi:hypothetical protein
MAEAQPTSSAGPAPSWVPAPILAVIAAVAWLLYSPMREAFYRNDDFAWLLIARRWERAPSMWPFIMQGHAGFTPAYNLIYYYLYRLAPQDPGPEWAGLIACHAACSVLVAVLAWRLTKSAGAAAGAGVIFAALYAHHEAVGWLGGGLHVYSLLWMLVALLAWMRWRERGGAGWVAVSLAAGLVGFLTKEDGLILPVLIAAYEFLPGERKPRWALAWWVLPYGAYVALHQAFPPPGNVVAVGGSAYKLGPHLLANLVLCVPQMIVPDLRFSNYAEMLRAHLPWATAYAAMLASLAAIILLTLGAIWVLVRGDALSRFAVAWCYLAFLPYAAFRYDYALAPRYLYLPSVGLALLLGHWLDGWYRRRPRPRAVRSVAAILVVFVAVNYLPLRVMTSHRLRDSQIRRNALATVQSVLPRGKPVRVLYVAGLPEHLTTDFGIALQACALPGYHFSTHFREGPPGLEWGEYAIRLDADGNLAAVRPTPTRGP